MRLRIIIPTLLFLALAAFAFSPYELGTFRDYRIMVYLKYWHVIDPPVVNPLLLEERLSSDEERLQLDAAHSAGFLDADPRIVKALLGFIDRPDVRPAAKDVAIWSLGELRVIEARHSLELRTGDDAYNQENLSRALAKIEGRTIRTFFPE